MTGGPIFSSNLTNRRNPSNSNYHMSINNRQAIQKSCIDRKSNAWFTLDLGFFRAVTVFKLLNDQQSEFRESSELIMYKLSYDMSTEKFQEIQKKFLYYKYESMQDCKIVTPESCVHVSSEAWRLLLAGTF